MDIAQEVRNLRDEMGMNRREFCDYYEIPYRTMVDWEAGKRKMPGYLLRLMEYKARMEKLISSNKYWFKIVKTITTWQKKRSIN